MLLSQLSKLLLESFFEQFETCNPYKKYFSNVIFITPKRDIMGFSQISQISSNFVVLICFKNFSRTLIFYANICSVLQCKQIVFQIITTIAKCVWEINPELVFYSFSHFYFRISRQIALHAIFKRGKNCAQ